MRDGPLDNVLRHIRSLVAARQTRELLDRELLERFITHHDEAAFAAIIERHGPLVMGVCRRLLRDTHHAEDACQATFLVLARQAGAIRKRDSLGSWLHGVARRVAGKLRVDVKRRAARDVGAGDLARPDTTGEITWREGLAVLDEELGRLPVMYRAALILCYLEGRTHDEAARELGCSAGALSGRLVRARECLRRRLVRRGVSLSAALLGSVLVSTQAVAALPPALAVGTVKAAASLLAGQALARVVPPQVATLAEGVLTAMSVTRAKTVVALALTMSLIGAGALTGAARSGRQAPAANEAVAPASVRPPSSPRAAPTEKDAGETRTVRGRVLGPDGKPFAGAKLYLHDPRLSGKDDGVRATSGSDGRFRFTLARSELTAAEDPQQPPAGQVMAVAQGCGCDWAAVGDADAGSELALRLVRDVPIRGRILDRDGRAVVGAKVRVSSLSAYPGDDLTRMLEAARRSEETAPLLPAKSWEGPVPGQARVLTTGADGRFRLAGLGRERTAELSVEGPAIAYTSITVMTRASEGILEPKAVRKVYGAAFDHLAAPSRPIRGVVRDKDGGKPVAGVMVSSNLSPRPATTDKDGRYELLGCPKSPTYTLYILPPDGRHFRTEVRVTDAPGLDPLAADIALPSGIMVRGRVIDKTRGKPLAGVRVSYYILFPNPKVGRVDGYVESSWSGLSSALTGPDGSFTVTALPGPGVLAAAAQPPSKYRPALLTPGELEEFFQERPGPVNSLDILAIRGTGAESNMAGPALLVQQHYHALALINPADEDKDLVHDLALLAPLTRRGTVVGPDGKPLPGVRAHGLGDEPEDGITLKSASFTVRNLHPRRTRYLCLYHRDKNLGRYLELLGDSTDPLKIQLQPGGRVVGRLVDRGGRPVAGTVIYFLRRDGRFIHRHGVEVKTDQDGRFLMDGLVPDQKYLLTRRTDGIGDSLPQAVAVKSGEKKDLGDIAVTVGKP